MQPIAGALHAKREHCINPLRAALFKRMSRVIKEWLREEKTCVRTDTGQVSDSALGQACDILNPNRREQPLELILNDVWQRANNDKVGRSVRVQRRHFRHQRLKTRIFALRKRRLNPAA